MREKACRWCPRKPSACICPSLSSVTVGGGNNLADGYVSFIGAKLNGAGKLMDRTMHSICIQTNGFFQSAKIEDANVRVDMTSAHQDLLGIPFGENRRYCLASRYEKLLRGGLQEGATDPYLSYSVVAGMLLPDVMKALD